MIDPDEFRKRVLSYKPELEPVIDNIMKDMERFDWALMEQYSHLCVRCAKCCEWHECLYLSDGLCTIYKRRPNACRDYPQYNLLGKEHGLNMDYECLYAIGIVIHEGMKELGKEGG